MVTETYVVFSVGHEDIPSNSDRTDIQNAIYVRNEEEIYQLTGRPD